MITIPLNIKKCSDFYFLLEKQKNYSYAFRKLYANFDKVKDKLFGDFIKKRFKMTEIEYRSLKSDVSNKISQTTTNKSDQEQRIVDIVSDLKELQTKDASNKITRSKFKGHNKLKQLEKSLPQNITFGGKQNFRELVKLHNNIDVDGNIQKIEDLTKSWKQSRILPFYILGEANQKSNRFFSFDFENKKIIYKPFKGKKVEITYSYGKKYQKMLSSLSELIKGENIAITISLTTSKICLSLDNEVLSGFCIDKQERRKEVSDVNKMDLSPSEKTSVIKQVYKNHYDNLKTKKLQGKIENRFIAVDLNPDYIGYCIADKGISGIEKIVEKGVIDFTKLNVKLGLSSDDKATVKQNNKRIHEVRNAWKQLFLIANHYRVAYFVKEDINNVGNNKKLDYKEANRKVKNIWHRLITEWQIEKRCVSSGIELIKVIPVYTSFIGNIMYNSFDATNSAIEICRRGMFKFEKGAFYPPITGTMLDTMSRFIEQQNIQLKPRDAQAFKDCRKWDKLFKIASDNGLRWRWSWDRVEIPFSTFSMNSVKSKVNIIRFSHCA